MMWFRLFVKRNFKHLSFILILLMIPFFAVTLNEFSKRDSSVVNIGYVGDIPAHQSGKVLSYTRFENKKEGKEALLNREIDTLWCFEDKISIINLEETEITKLTKEKLFCLIYPQIAKDFFEEYMRENISGGESITKEELDAYYSYKDVNTHVVDVVTIDSDGNERETRESILTSPVRGILSVIVMLSALVAVLYTMKDRKRGLFSIFHGRKKVLLTLQSILSALIPTSLILLLSFYFTGLWEGVLREILGVAVLTVTSLAFALFLSSITNLSAFCVLLPTVTVSALFISPVFQGASFGVVQYIFPTYYYLYSFSDSSVYLASAVYFALLTCLSFLSEKLKRC